MPNATVKGKKQQNTQRPKLVTLTLINNEKLIEIE